MVLVLVQSGLDRTAINVSSGMMHQSDNELKTKYQDIHLIWVANLPRDFHVFCSSENSDNVSTVEPACK